MTTDPDLAFALDLAQRAGALVMESFGKAQRVDKKSARDVVTAADFQSEALVMDAIRERFPDDAILAEESGRHAGVDEARNGANGRVWVIDPIDGTVNYANGIPFFCVSVALVTDGRPSAGVVLDPARGECYSATLDGPAELNGEPVRASEKEAIGDYVISLTVIGSRGIARERAISREVRIPRRMGSAALALAYVASGRFDAMIQSGGLSLWDVAAAGLIAERAGAIVSDHTGGPWFDLENTGRKTSIVAAPAPHHARFVELLAGARGVSKRI